MATSRFYHQQIDDGFAYQYELLNKADIDGNLTIGGIWFQDQVLTDRFSGYKQVWTAFSNHTIEWGNPDVTTHTFIATGINSLKVKVGSSVGRIWNEFNLTDNSQLGNGAGYLQANDLDGFLYDVQYNSTAHTLTFYQQNEPNIVIDLPIESLIKGVALVGNDLVFTFEDGSTASVPLNTLLVGVVKEVNGKTPNSAGQIVLNVTDIPNLSSELANKLDIRMANLVSNLSQAEKNDIYAKLGIVNNVVQVLGISGHTITLSNGGGSVVVPFTDWPNIPNKPTSYPPSAHLHNIPDVNNLQGALNAKQDVLTAGANVQISPTNVISATDTTYSFTVGQGLAILKVGQNVEYSIAQPTMDKINHGETAYNSIGFPLSNLNTTHKTDLIGAINEVNGKAFTLPYASNKASYNFLTNHHATQQFRIYLDRGFSGDIILEVTGSYANQNVNGIIRIEGGLGYNQGSSPWHNNFICTDAHGATLDSVYIHPQAFYDSSNGLSYFRIDKWGGGNQLMINMTVIEAWNNSIILQPFLTENGTTVTTERNKVTFRETIFVDGNGNSYMWNRAYNDAILRNFGHPSINGYQAWERGFAWINGSVTGLGQFPNWTGCLLAFGNSDHKSQLLVSKSRLLFRTNYGATDDDTFKEVWTDQNFNPASKVDVMENAIGVGFSNGSFNALPYIYHKTGGYKILVTAEYLFAQDYASVTYVNQQLNNIPLHYVYAINGNDANTPRNFDNEIDKTYVGSVIDQVDGLYYNIINIRHRNGVGDGNSYGGQIRFGMTGRTDQIEFRNHYNGNWSNWYILATSSWVSQQIASIPVHNGQLTVNTTADLVGGYTYLPSGNVTTTLGLATHILNAIADGQAAYNTIQNSNFAPNNGYDYIPTGASQTIQPTATKTTVAIQGIGVTITLQDGVNDGDECSITTCGGQQYYVDGSIVDMCNNTTHEAQTSTLWWWHQKDNVWYQAI